MADSLRRRLRDPVLWTNALQIVKTVAAAVIAWVLAVHVFHIAQAFLAPWAALLTVHATVYRTLKRGVQQVGASVLGVLLAFAAGSALGLDALSLGVVLLAGLLAGSVRGLRAETTTAAATALVVLTAGYSSDGGMLVARLLDTGIGIAVGLLVNLLVWPPLRDRAAAHQVGVIDDRIGALLSDMAGALRGGCSDEDIDGWIVRTGELDHDIEQAWSVVRQARESGRLNPSRRARPHAGGRGLRRDPRAGRARGRRDAQHDPHDPARERPPRRLGSQLPHAQPVEVPAPALTTLRRRTAAGAVVRSAGE
jgi:uncharacterized membrane protein YccC